MPPRPRVADTRSPARGAAQRGRRSSRSTAGPASGEARRSGGVGSAPIRVLSEYPAVPLVPGPTVGWEAACTPGRTQRRRQQARAPTCMRSAGTSASSRPTWADLIANTTMTSQRRRPRLQHPDRAWLPGGPQPAASPRHGEGRRIGWRACSSSCLARASHSSLSSSAISRSPAKSVRVWHRRGEPSPSDMWQG